MLRHSYVVRQSKPETVANAIRIGNPQSWNHAKAVVRDSKVGSMNFKMLKFLKHNVYFLCMRVFVEPASAASIGGAIRDIKAVKLLKVL